MVGGGPDPDPPGRLQVQSRRATVLVPNRRRVDPDAQADAPAAEPLDGGEHPVFDVGPRRGADSFLSVYRYVHRLAE